MEVISSPEREVQELSRSSLEQPPRKEPRVERPQPQTEGRQEDTQLPGFEPSDDELLIGTLCRDIPRLRQENQRREPLVIRNKGREEPTRRQEPQHMRGQTPGALTPASVIPTDIGAPQPTPIERTLLDRLAEIRRPEAMSRTIEEDQAVWEVANGGQAERNLANQKYKLSVSSHPTLAELMDTMDHQVHYAKNDITLAWEARDKALVEARRLKEDLQQVVENHQKIMELRSVELREL
ncbi:hypothetical protein R1flu_016147 [Riccia fluitans]|uniref:Uncharacterized protein n=1 Tax=Riccia fluitans TaxID=41844 RepID=A0ABD1YLG9_9MARC